MAEAVAVMRDITISISSQSNSLSRIKEAKTLFNDTKLGNLYTAPYLYRGFLFELAHAVCAWYNKKLGASMRQLQYTSG